jgi:hypothetical protein
VSLKSCPLRSLRRPPNLALPPFKSFGCFFRIALLHSLSNVVVASQSMLKVPHSGQRRHNVPSANNTGRVTRSTLHQWSLPYRTTVWLYREGGGGQFATKKPSSGYSSLQLLSGAQAKMRRSATVPVLQRKQLGMPVQRCSSTKVCSDDDTVICPLTLLF